MRWFFYLLLASNLLYLGWYLFAEKHTLQVIDSTSLSGGKRLVLLSEVAQPELRISNVAPVEQPQETAKEPQPAAQVVEGDNAETAPEPAPPTAQFACLRIGNIATQTTQKAMLDAVEQGQGKVMDKGTEQGTKINYWVLLPPAKSRQAASKVAAQLKAKGVKDFYLVRDDENTNAISLGVYSSESSVKRRQREIRDLGIGLKPQIRELELAAQRYWLTIQFEADKVVDNTVFSSLDSNARVSTIPCEK